MISAAPGVSFAAGARRVAEHRIGAVVVVDYGRLVGILAARDLLEHIADELGGLLERPCRTATASHPSPEGRNTSRGRSLQPTRRD